MNHLTEESLIEFHLHETGQRESVSSHLEACAECAALSEGIAETLRVFSAEPVPEPNLTHQWQRLRGSLPPVSLLPVAPARRPRVRFLLWPAAAMLACIAIVLTLTYKPARKPAAEAANHRRPGPLTATPRNPEIAQQVDAAERFLTVVNHTTGPLDPDTLAEAHQLLLKNALYVRAARDEGDYGTAAVLDNFGRVLTDLNHRPPAGDSTWHLRFEWNTDGLLLDLRILRQNNAKP
jgi:hypothetical protein